MSKTKKQGRTAEQHLEATRRVAQALRIEVEILDDTYAGISPCDLSDEQNAVCRWCGDIRHVIYDLERAAEQLARAIEEEKVRREADEYVASARR